MDKTIVELLLGLLSKIELKKLIETMDKIFGAILKLVNLLIQHLDKK